MNQIALPLNYTPQNVAKIELSQGFVTLVDAKDYDWLNQWKWHYGCDGYAVRNYYDAGKKFHTVLMHRAILQTPPGMFTDHINGERLFNCRSNLRICTNAENAHNQRISVKNTSGYKGVCWNKSAKKWVAHIQSNSRKRYLGLYDSPEAAALAYDIAARVLFGKFASTNYSAEMFRGSL
jgi:hypothetical protein